MKFSSAPRPRGSSSWYRCPRRFAAQLVEKYREHFRDEEPVVEEGLYSPDSKLVYPIVSDIPIMLIDEALPASVLGR